MPASTNTISDVVIDVVALLRPTPVHAAVRGTSKDPHEWLAKTSNDAFSQSSFLYGGNAAYVEQLYDEYRRDPAKVDASWREFFEGLKDES